MRDGYTPSLQVLAGNTPQMIHTQLSPTILNNPLALVSSASLPYLNGPGRRRIEGSTTLPLPGFPQPSCSSGTLYPVPFNSGPFFFGTSSAAKQPCALIRRRTGLS